MLTVGACLSLTGRFARFGRQAAAGLHAWSSLANANPSGHGAGDAVAVRICDDASDRGRLVDGLRELVGGCDLLLGPYSTGLLRAAGPVVAEHDCLLFNHGGAGDDVQAQRPGQIVSVLAPTGRYAGPFVRARPADVPLWVVHGPGAFARQVAAGAVGEARRRTDEPAVVEVDASGRWTDGVPERWDLFSAGRFEDDVAIVRAALACPRPPRAICSIAAGVRDFVEEIADVEGIYGIVQWAPGRSVGAGAGAVGGGPDPESPFVGPDELRFLAAYRALAGGEPDYVAVQAAATAAIAVRCATTADSVATDALWSAAVALRAETMLGAFAIDPGSGTQAALEPLLVRWGDGAPRPVER